MIQVMGHADAVLFWFADAILLCCAGTCREANIAERYNTRRTLEVIVKSNDWKHLLTKLLVKFGVANVERPF